MPEGLLKAIEVETGLQGFFVANGSKAVLLRKKKVVVELNLFTRASGAQKTRTKRRKGFLSPQQGSEQVAQPAS